MNYNLKIWRQKDASDRGGFASYKVENIDGDTSFLEMMDVLNQQLVSHGEEPVSYDHDCREGVCGMCSMYINGRAHGPNELTTTCQLYMRHFKDGATITIEPWRAKPFPVIKDLMVDRSAFDRIQQAGAYISMNSGSAADANDIMITKEAADDAFNAAECIGCGACVATCKNSSASLFVSAKLAQFALLPQGQVERYQRTLNMVQAMDAEGFGSCTNTGACEAECPKGISVKHIAMMNHDYLKATMCSEKTMD